MGAKKVNQEISNLIKNWDIAYGKAMAPFIDWLLLEIRKRPNKTINQLINEGWKLFDIESKIREATIRNTMEATRLKAISLKPSAQIESKALKNTLLYVPWASDDRDMSSRMQLANTSTKKYIANQVKEDFTWVKDYEKNLKSLNVKVLKKADLSILRREVRDLTRTIRKIGFTRDYTTELAKLNKVIESMSEMNYTTSDTKKAYQTFIRGVKTQNIEAFEKAVEETIKKKSRYISRRIARTEQARASLDALLLEGEQDTDVIGWKWHLDASHKVSDECDLYAKANFGLGQGVFPKNRVPMIPSHPNCICYLTEVYDGEIEDLRKFSFSKGGNTFLNKFPAREQNKILKSSSNGKAFRKGKDWDKSTKVMGENPKPLDLKSRFEKNKEIKEKLI